MSKQISAVEWFYNELKNLIKESELTEMKPSEFDKRELELINQAKAKERIQKAEEYLKGFNDGKEFKKKLDELTFSSNKQIMSTDIPITNKDKEELMEILNRMQRNLTFKSE